MLTSQLAKYVARGILVFYAAVIQTVEYAALDSLVTPNVITEGTIQRDTDDGLPIYFVDYHQGYPIYGRNKDRRFPNIAEGITIAIVFGQPDVLTYEKDDLAAGRRRYAAYGSAGAATLSDGSTGQWDEYPFASTLEGGAGAHITAVSQTENNWHSQDYLAFLRAANLITGTQKRFHVIPTFLLSR